MIAHTHKLLTHIGVYAQIKNLVRSGYPHVLVLVLEKPVQKGFPFTFRKLRALVNSVLRCVSVGDNDSAAVVELLPVGLVACVAVNGIKA